MMREASFSGTITLSRLRLLVRSKDRPVLTEPLKKRGPATHLRLVVSMGSLVECLEKRGQSLIEFDWILEIAHMTGRGYQMKSGSFDLLVHELRVLGGR